MCRQGAKQITDIVSESGKAVRLVAVAKETLGNEEFTKTWWPAPAELYFDGDPVALPIFKQANGKAMGLIAGAGNYMVGGKVADAIKSSATTEGNYEGEGKILGSVLVISKSGELLMHHTEKVWGDHPADETLMGALAKL